MSCRRNKLGSALAEFAPALMILVGLVIVPLLDLTIIPIRWMLAQEIVNSYARRLALCETFSQSHAAMVADPSLQDRLQNVGGVSVESIDLHLRIARVHDQTGQPEELFVSRPGTIPADWLPGGGKGPCTYSLEVDVHSQMSPAIVFSGIRQRVPGLTAPIPLTIRGAHNWQNYGRDPNNGKYFLNE